MYKHLAVIIVTLLTLPLYFVGLILMFLYSLLLAPTDWYDQVLASYEDVEQNYKK